MIFLPGNKEAKQEKSDNRNKSEMQKKKSKKN